jgi:serine phosphatase RsbU (regulator of sigma subunit)/DNA-binding response OmpR family regulator
METQDAEASILIVDDTPTNLRMLAQMLSQHGYKVLAVNSGARAIESARIYPPDLIMLDIMMPELDGYATCQRLKAEPATRDIPIIFISALDAVEDKVRAFTAGGVDYVTKPFHEQEVIVRVETHLTLQKMHRRLQQQNDQLQWEIAERQAANAALAALNRVAFAVNHSLDLEADLEAGLKIVLQELKLEYAWLFVPEDGDQLLRLAVALGLPEDFRRQEALTPASRCACIEVLAGDWSNSQIERKSCQRLAAYSEQFPDLPSEHISLPVFAKRKVVGVLNLAGSHMTSLTQANYAWLEMVARQMGNAIENALLYQNTLNKAERLTVINRVSTIISHSWQLERVLPPLLSELARILDMSLGIIVLRAEGNQERYKPYIHIGPWQAKASLAAIAWHELPLINVIEQTKAPLLMLDPAQDERIKPLASLIERENIQTVLTVPLAAHGQLVGFIQLYAIGRKCIFETAEMELARTLTNQAALAVEKARLYQATVTRYEQELEIARQIQQNLLPRIVPDISHLRLAGLCQPAYMTGGDFYDYVLMPEQRLGIVVGDVTGKSLPAALVMALARNTIRSELVNLHQPAAAMTAANHWLCQDIQRGTFVATVQALIDASAQKMWLVNAGQVAALLVRDKRTEYLLPEEAAGLPLGIEPDRTYTQAEIELQPGDILIFYTDGLVEARNVAREMFGFERLEAAAQRLQIDRSPEQIIADMLAEVQAFVGKAEQHDDITLVVVQISPA